MPRGRPRRKGFVRGQSAERTWLIGILKRKLIDHIRKRTRERATFEPDAPPENDLKPAVLQPEGALEPRPEALGLKPV